VSGAVEVCKSMEFVGVWFSLPGVQRSGFSIFLVYLCGQFPLQSWERAQIGVEDHLSGHSRRSLFSAYILGALSE